MKRIKITAAVLALMLTLCGCMYSRKIVVDNAAQPSNDWSAVAENALNVETSAYFVKYIGIDASDRLISLNESTQTTFISAAPIDDQSSRDNIISMEGITDAVIANHGKNILFRTREDSETALYSYSINSQTVKMLYKQPSYNVKSRLYASAATDSVTEVIKDGAEYYIASFDLMTGERTVYSIATNSMDNTLKYIAGSADIEGVFVDDFADGERIIVKATSKVGSYVVSALNGGGNDDILSSEASTLAPQYSGGLLFYTNKKNELMALNLSSRTERRLAENVKSFAVSADRGSVAYVTTEGGNDRLYLLADANSKARLLDLRKGIEDIIFSCWGEHLLVSYDFSDDGEFEYLIYPINYE